MKTAVPSPTHNEATQTAADQQTLRSIVGSSKPAAYLNRYRKLSGRIGAVLLVTAALVGIATIRNTPEVSVVTAVPTQPEIIQAAKPEAAVASEPITDPITGSTSATAPLIGDFGFSSGSPDQFIPTSSSVKAEEPLTARKPEAMPSPPPPAAVAEVPQPASEPTTTRKEFVEPTTAKKEFIEIAVQLTIQDGRVAEAQVGNRQPGAEAFEATALHIARQRRYPPGTARTETVVVRVANQFVRKEP